VSADFLASDFIAEVELPRLLAGAEGQGMTILPVLLSACGFDRSALGCFQAVNDPARPLITLGKAGKEAVWNQVGKAVDAALAPSQVEPEPINPTSTSNSTPDPEPFDQPAGPWTVWVGDPGRGAPPSPTQRLQGLWPGSNPYVAGSSLQAGSPVFFGRNSEQRQIVDKLTADQPGSVSLLGERRSGKSSLLNQLVRALAARPRVLTLHSSAQSWSDAEQGGFFEQLCAAIANGLGLGPPAPGRDYVALRNLVLAQAREGWRFVLVIDEFEKLAGNPRFDSGFFSLLRVLGERSEYRLAWLIASRRPLEALCREHELDSSSFWNIFGIPWVLGLLHEREAEDLVRVPTRHSLTRPVEPPLARVRALAGDHPALIQMVMVEWWPAAEVGSPPDWRRIGFGLRSYYQGLWRCRSEAEQACLRVLAMDEADAQIGARCRGALLDGLYLRGLVAGDGRLFSAGFAGFVREQAEVPATPATPPRSGDGE